MHFIPRTLICEGNHTLRASNTENYGGGPYSSLRETLQDRQTKYDPTTLLG